MLPQSIPSVPLPSQQRPNMPILLEPGATFDVWLKSDEDKPAATRPTFTAKAQSMRGQRKILAVIDLIFADGVTVGEVFDKSRDCLFDSLDGWRNMGRPFSSEAIEDALTFEEIRELLRKIGHNQRMSGDEKK